MRLRKDERGIALPSPVAMVSLGAVVVAGVAFVVTSGGAEEVTDGTRPAAAAPTPAPSGPTRGPVIRKAQKQPDAKKTKRRPPRPEPIRRSDVYVEVYNNSGITGLAGSTANTIAGAGWQVVGSDNWYGTIPASTVYYPDRLEKQGRLLAKDLGISRVIPSISPMRLDRLTVILTTDYA